MHTHNMCLGVRIMFCVVITLQSTFESQIKCVDETSVASQCSPHSVLVPCHSPRPLQASVPSAILPLLISHSTLPTCIQGIHTYIHTYVHVRAYIHTEREGEHQ